MTWDCHIRRSKIDGQMLELVDGKIGPIEQYDQFLLSRLPEDDAVGGKLAFSNAGTLRPLANREAVGHGARRGILPEISSGARDRNRRLLAPRGRRAGR